MMTAAARHFRVFFMRVTFSRLKIRRYAQTTRVPRAREFGLGMVATQALMARRVGFGLQCRLLFAIGRLVFMGSQSGASLLVMQTRSRTCNVIE